MTIHKEGRKILVALLIIFVILNTGIYFNFSDTTFNISLISCLILFLIVLQFFRHPRVKTNVDRNLVYAPADGKVVVIEDTEEQEYLHERRKQVSIFMSPVNVHVNRSPVSGKVKYLKYHPGKYLVAWHPKSSTENERNSVVIEMENGLQILFRQIAGIMARRIKCYIQEGQNLLQGEEFGFIKFGSRVDVFLPVNSKIIVKINERTTAGKTVIAELIH